jgi:hypothetical protein
MYPFAQLVLEVPLPFAMLRKDKKSSVYVVASNFPASNPTMKFVAKRDWLAPQARKLG